VDRRYQTIVAVQQQRRKYGSFITKIRAPRCEGMAPGIASWIPPDMAR